MALQEQENKVLSRVYGEDKAALFPEHLVNELINQVRGKSTLAKLSKQMPIAFNGNQLFTFNLDNEIDIVAENGKKTHGGVSILPKKVLPIKVEYGARISDEFLYASAEEQIDILKPFVEGFAKKMAKGFDIMAMHGVNPRSGETSEVIGNNHFDKLIETTVEFDEKDPDTVIEGAVRTIQGSERVVSGLALAPTFATALASYKVNNVKQFPEFSWGANPSTVNGLDVDVNNTVSHGKEQKDVAIIGDFENMFRYGYAKEMPLEVIKYGDPDNSGKDLKGYNQIYLRCEAYIGWVILDEKSFVRVESKEVKKKEKNFEM